MRLLRGSITCLGVISCSRCDALVVVRRPAPLSRQRTTQCTRVRLSSNTVEEFSDQINFIDRNGNYEQSSSSTKSSDPQIAGSLGQYERDVTTVLKQIYSSAQDKEIPAFMRTPRLSFTNIWDLEDWRRHQSRWRWVRYIRTFPGSRLLRRIAPQMTAVTAWAVLVLLSLIHMRTRIFNAVHMPLATLSLLSTFVVGLETLRSNQGLARLSEGRVAVGKATLMTRDTAHLLASFVYPKDEALGLLAARHLSLYMWLLKAQLRGSQEDAVVHTMLPWKIEASYVLRQRKKPVATLSRLRQIITSMRKQQLLTQAEQMLIMNNIKELDNVLMVTERIRGAPIPPFYSSHAGRLTLFYLFFLPVALLGMLNGLQLNAVITTCVTAAISFAVLGLDEVSIILEQPFRLMPLYQHSKNSMLDVSDAFLCQPPPIISSSGSPLLFGSLNGDELEQPSPLYW